MSSWLKKVVRNYISATAEQPEELSESKQSKCKVIVSFDQHQQLEQDLKSKTIQSSIQPTKRLKSMSSSRQATDNSFRQSYASQMAQPEQSLDYQRLQTEYADEIDFLKHKNEQPNAYICDLSDENSADESLSDEDKTTALEKQDCLEAPEEIMNNLVGMYNLMKMTRHIQELRGEYLTLKKLNHILSDSTPQYLMRLIDYILSKSAEIPDLERMAQEPKNNPYNKTTKSVTFRKNQPEKDQSQQNTSISQLILQKKYCQNYSNFFLYQYYPVRALTWKLVSGYLPEQREKWIWKMEKSLLTYRQLVKELIIEVVLLKKKKTSSLKNDPQDVKAIREKSATVSLMNSENESKVLKGNGDSSRLSQAQRKQRKLSVINDPLLNPKSKPTKDHPLNQKVTSKWKTYFEDFELWKLIEKDTKRTRQNCPFFHEHNTLSLVNTGQDLFSQTASNDPESRYVTIQLSNSQKVNFDPNEVHLSSLGSQSHYQTTYIDSLTRIIFIYLKSNPHQKYYQGMNEIAAIIYYCLTNKNGEYFRRVSESDAYHIFSRLLNQLSVSPLLGPSSLEGAESHRKLQHKFNHFISGQKYFELLLHHMIKKSDKLLYEKLIEKTNGQSLVANALEAFAIRWFMTIFLSEFNIDQALILWDSVMVVLGAEEHLQNSSVSSGSKAKHRNSLKGLSLTQFILYLGLTVVHLNRKSIIEGDASTLMLKFQKISQKPEQIIEKCITLYKSFPKLLKDL